MKSPALLSFSFIAFILGATLSVVTPAARANNADKPEYPATQLFINNHRYGDKNGCSITLGTTGRSTCGHHGHVSEVAWTFLRRTPQGDLFKITRKHPSDSATSRTETKEVTYAGKLLVLWQDAFQKIVLRPEAKE